MRLRLNRMLLPGCVLIVQVAAAPSPETALRPRWIDLAGQDNRLLLATSYEEPAPAPELPPAAQALESRVDELDLRYRQELRGFFDRCGDLQACCRDILDFWARSRPPEEASFVADAAMTLTEEGVLSEEVLPLLTKVFRLATIGMSDERVLRAAERLIQKIPEWYQLDDMSIALAQATDAVARQGLAASAPMLSPMARPSWWLEQMGPSAAEGDRYAALCTSVCESLRELPQEDTIPLLADLFHESLTWSTPEEVNTRVAWAIAGSLDEAWRRKKGKLPLRPYYRGISAMELPEDWPDADVMFGPKGHKQSTSSILEVRKTRETQRVQAPEER